jgi:hypothetical protein
MRMQIEQAFRDRKNHRHGWSMHHVHTRSKERLAVVILLASLAEVAVQLVGRAVAATAIAKQFQSNTVRSRRVLSFFFVGCRAIAQHICPTAQQLQTALQQCSAKLLSIAQNFAPE